MSYIQRYPELWSLLQQLEVGLTPDHTMMETVALLAVALDQERSALRAGLSPLNDPTL